MSTRSEVISLAGYHGWECGMKDMYEIILNNTTAISGGRVNSGDTNDYSRLALRVRGFRTYLDEIICIIRQSLATPCRGTKINKIRKDKSISTLQTSPPIMEYGTW